MYKNLVSTRSAIAAIGLALAAVLLASAQQPQTMEGKTAEQYYKNIQVLQGIPADQLVPAMRVIRASLGVECEFCHVDDRSKDDKPEKKTAREMMTMVFNINKTTFNGRQQVACVTCHRGSNQPLSVPPLPEMAALLSPPAPKPAPAAAPTVDQILAKYVDALGGEQALRKITSRGVTATADLPPGPNGAPGAHPAVQQFYKAPNLQLMTVQTQAGTTSTGFDGTSAWSQDAKGAVTDATGLALARAKRGSDFYEPLDLKTEYTRLIVRGMDNVRGHDVYVVFAVPQGDSAERLYFDAQTGLLLRKWSVTPTPIGTNPLQVDYDDYRDAGNGVKLPFLIQVESLIPAQVRAYHVTKVQNNAPMDDGKFAKPTSAAPAQ